jgi:glycogenin glucosyltransferase
LHCWKLVQYSKCVFLDADTLVRDEQSISFVNVFITLTLTYKSVFYQILKNCDELFDRDELSAAPDAGWPDCFNSGVFVFVPSEDTFKVNSFTLLMFNYGAGYEDV